MKKKRLIFWAVVALFFGIIFIKQQFSIGKLNGQYASYKEQLSKLQFQKNQLNEQLKQTTTDGYVERLAREKLGLVKPGEIIFKSKK
jgi:cell division protein FtsB